MTMTQTYSPVSDSKVQNILKLIQGATRSKNVRKGINESTKCLNKGTALLVVIACDAEPQEITAFLPIICEDKGVPFVHIPSKSALGVACGIHRPIAACTIYLPKGSESLRLEEKIKEALQ
ncbi:rRNA processing protein [Encephalitozoon intestinalis ATCC 50506]|uniref:H/ACA ribonucleoprotein complex subunit 2 n=1 Tax=Encephalitozoon intestinalis (strain ATCC 50506) TaxID=876142 RepID=E0S7W9_ENCIT|nr:rRNA processing protein [Encephalitozoon intestinalis ATCC 50506]ADM11804.1 50S ribosomal protein L7Ae [Encephalitozoon intestinalis ATCC 50506]UTX45554.1 box C/D snornp and U4 snrnp component SNU13P [Encephalitozoon intestinalis]